jgi:hypothetical protein
MDPGESSPQTGLTRPSESAAPAELPVVVAVAAPATQPVVAAPVAPSLVDTTQPDAAAPDSSEAQSLKQLIGVTPAGLQPVELQKLPVMSLRGFVQPSDGGQPRALLEINELDRSFLVQVGTEIPVTMQGRLSPIGHNELTGLPQAGGEAAPPPPQQQDAGQSQIILKVLRVTPQGVTVRAGLIDQTIVIR